MYGLQRRRTAGKAIDKLVVVGVSLFLQDKIKPPRKLYRNLTIRDAILNQTKISAREYA